MFNGERGKYKYTNNLDHNNGAYTVPKKGIYVCSFNIIHTTIISANNRIILDDLEARLEVIDPNTNVTNNFGQWVLNTRNKETGVVRTMSISESYEFLKDDIVYLTITPNRDDTQNIRIEGGIRLLVVT